MLNRKLGERVSGCKDTQAAQLGSDTTSPSCSEGHLLLLTNAFWRNSECQKGLVRAAFPDMPKGGTVAETSTGLVPKKKKTNR